jgi:hypothetical protein
MPKLKIVASENYEQAFLGAKIKNNGRDYFEPAMGITFAHDLIEHPTKPHPNGFADEFMALGAIVAGRIETGWSNAYGRRLTTGDLSRDVFNLISTCDYLPSCRSTIRGNDLDEMRAAIREGIEEAKSECYDAPNLDDILGWMCKGHQAFRRRFYHLDLYNVTNFLFDSIATKVDNWLSNAIEGNEAFMYLDFTNYRVEIEDYYC